MNHLKLIIAMALTCVLAAVANVIVARITGFNLFTLKIWAIVPAGAAIIGFAGSSGAVLAARYFNIKPKWIDAIPMMFIAAATMGLIYYLDYATLVLDDGAKASKLVDFWTYVDLALTKTHMRFGRGARDLGEVGQAGYYLAAIEFFGFLAGGLATLGIIRGMTECARCGAYVRKLKEKKTPGLTFDEAAALIDYFQNADLETMQALLAWNPEERKLDAKSERAVITYTLYGCPGCRSEAIIATVNAFSGKEWKDVPALARRRNLDISASLRDAFDLGVATTTVASTEL
jgi:hypothetical protein